ncbi:hypothetical protein KIL84_000317 [Mauremys mutica]|uniref:Uncharacterized protein n=1 Tax=Mauremys mutica TaxID=74926 RepID=A0A9D3XG39_9SAUR|nr:hypothetical protein KIL84_000317 [Mauremys mutica]
MGTQEKLASRPIPQSPGWLESWQEILPLPPAASPSPTLREGAVGETCAAPAGAQQGPGEPELRAGSLAQGAALRTCEWALAQGEGASWCPMHPAGLASA